MAYTPTIQNNFPVVGASEDTWGGTNNARWGEAYNDINAVATLANANEVKANAALPKAGGVLTGDVSVPDAGPTGVFSVGFRGVPVVSLNEDRTFNIADAAKMIRLFGNISRTWTIPPVSSVPFPIGTVIVVRNYGVAGTNITLARGAGVALRVDGSPVDSNKIVTAYGKATLIHEDTNIWSVSGVGVA